MIAPSVFSTVYLLELNYINKVLIKGSKGAKRAIIK
jgi:hypothetical protein